VIDAGHVTLRPWDRSDTSFVYDAGQDAEIRRSAGLPTPFTAGDAAGFIERHARPQPEDNGAFFAMTRTDNGELLGSVALDPIDWAFRTASVGCWVVLDARRQGVASAGLRALVRWGFASIGLVEATASVAVEDRVSRRVVEQAGFVLDGEADADHVRYLVRAGH
jgi:RimJ/RimL family protein N-acetyltransferase